jgi:hypothetical protein
MLELRAKLGNVALNDSLQKNRFPKRGVYFFFERGEHRSDGKSPRVVRVGTHALTQGSTSTFWGRLCQHRGFIEGSMAGGGNHRGSVFRKHVGAALINQQQSDAVYPCWYSDSSITKGIRVEEYEMEKQVSQVVRAMPFLWVEVDDEPGSLSPRGVIERNSIALLSNYNQSDKVDKPSQSWLGNWSINDKIRESGLWNVNHVDDEPEAFLDILDACASRTHILN